jgi:hypothetical protein
LFTFVRGADDFFDAFIIGSEITRVRIGGFSQTFDESDNAARFRDVIILDWCMIDDKLRRHTFPVTAVKQNR